MNKVSIEFLQIPPDFLGLCLLVDGRSSFAKSTNVTPAMLRFADDQRPSTNDW